MSSADCRLLLRACGYVVLALGLALLALAPRLAVQADTGPKPKMAFTFKFEGDPIDIVSGQQIECQDSLCTEGEPLVVGGPQRFWCDAVQCQSMAYGYAPFHKIVVEFADRTRESNVFRKVAFSAAYTVTVLADRLLVEERPAAGFGGFSCASAALPVFAVGLGLLHLGRPRRSATLDARPRSR